jgi:hypothetical protein
VPARHNSDEPTPCLVPHTRPPAPYTHAAEVQARPNREPTDSQTTRTGGHRAPIGLSRPEIRPDRGQVARQGTGHASHVPQHAPPCGRARGWLPKKWPPQGSLIQHDTTTRNGEARTGGHGAPIEGVGRQARYRACKPCNPSTRRHAEGQGGGCPENGPPQGSLVQHDTTTKNGEARVTANSVTAEERDRCDATHCTSGRGCPHVPREIPVQVGESGISPRSSCAHQRATFRAVAVCARERRHVLDATRNMRRSERPTHHRTCTPRCSRRRPEAAALTPNSRRRYQQGGTDPCGDPERG